MKKTLLTLTLALGLGLTARAQSYWLPMHEDVSIRYESHLIDKTRNFHAGMKPYAMGREEKFRIDSLLFLETGLDQLDRLASRDFLDQWWGDGGHLAVNPILTSFFDFDLTTEFNPHEFLAGAAAQASWRKFSLGANLAFMAHAYEEYEQPWMRRSGMMRYYGRPAGQSGQAQLFPLLDAALSYRPNAHFAFTLGNGKHHIGHGYRSLMLSENGPTMPFLKIETTAWRLKFVNLLARTRDFDYHAGDWLLRPKWMASHWLSFNATDRLNLYLFETVIWSPSDSLQRPGFEPNYLNPFVFYRPVEYSIGSPDNVLLGAGFDLSPFHKFHFYGQFLLDELTFSKLFRHQGWWSNKFAWQFGAKWYQAFFVEGLFLQAEYNMARPYTYSHLNSTRAYGSHFMPLAHPMGANFHELVGTARVDLGRVGVKFKGYHLWFGDELSDSLTVGSSIYPSYNTRISDTGNYVGQGVSTTRYQAELSGSYLLNPRLNLEFELGVGLRIQKTLGEIQNYFLYAGLRTNIFNENP